MNRAKPHILILPRWYPNKTDIQLGTFIRQQTLLLKDDFDMAVIYVQADHTLKEEFELVENSADGIHEIVVYFKPGNGVLSKVINAKRYKKAQQLGYEKIKKPVQLCHVHVPYRSAFLALQLLRKNKIPFVITEHWSGHLTGEYQQKNSIDKQLYKRVLKKAAAIACVSDVLAKKFKENTGFAAAVIPNFIDFFPVDEEREPTNKIQLLSVSDMADSVKNVSGLVKAFSDALKINPDLHLTLIGGGPDEEKILGLIADLNLQKNCSFRGRLPHQAVLSAMNSCHFYICNSTFETFGMTVAEAIRCGKPVVCTKCGGPMAFLNAGNSIIINPYNDLQTMEGILKMATDFEKFDSVKMADEIEQRFGKAQVRKKLVTFYKSFI